MNASNNKIDWPQLVKTVKSSLEKENTGHDYEHAKRVLANAIMISKSKQIDNDVLLAACLLHDIAFKDGFVVDHHIVGAKQSKEILKKINFPKEKIEKVVLAIEDHMGNIVAPIRKAEELQIESKILRDADNIDALGEIGLQRAIKFNQNVNRPEIISLKDKFEDSLYGALKGMIAWPDKMLTPEGKSIGKERTKVMEEYLKKIENQKR